MRKGYRSGKIVECKTCGEQVYSYPSEDRKFCSPVCRYRYYKGEGNPKWRGGKTSDKDGYVYAYAPGHPYANKDNCVFEHRLIMENVLGRFLLPTENPHHLNGIKNDNRPDNLVLIKSLSEHSRIHHQIRKIVQQKQVII